MTQEETTLYTPVEKSTNKRLAIHALSKEVRALSVGDNSEGYYKGKITDTENGKVYVISSKSCGLSCLCDAYAEEIVINKKVCRVCHGKDIQGCSYCDIEGFEMGTDA